MSPGYLHFFHVDSGGWQHDSSSFVKAGKLTGAISAVFEPQRNHASVFVKGDDGSRLGFGSAITSNLPRNTSGGDGKSYLCEAVSVGIS
jgi:hypothetical protein